MHGPRPGFVHPAEQPNLGAILHQPFELPEIGRVNSDIGDVGRISGAAGRRTISWKRMVLSSTIPAESPGTPVFTQPIVEEVRTHVAETA
jgi:hypothetical protein